jgi:hypothetical protein
MLDGARICLVGFIVHGRKLMRLRTVCERAGRCTGLPGCPFGSLEIIGRYGNKRLSESDAQFVKDRDQQIEVHRLQWSIRNQPIERSSADPQPAGCKPSLQFRHADSLLPQAGADRADYPNGIAHR